MFESRGDFNGAMVVGALWERQPCDTSKSWAAFEIYRNAGPQRSMNNITDQVGVKTKLLLRWSMKYAWVMRCDAYDKHHESIRRDILEQTLKVRYAAEAERTADLIHKAKTVVMHDLDIMVANANDPDYKNEPLLNQKTTVQLLDRIVMLERIITGQSTSKTENQSTSVKHVVNHRIVDNQRKQQSRVEDAEFETIDSVDGTEGDGGTVDNEVVDLSPGGVPPGAITLPKARRGPAGNHA